MRIDSKNRNNANKEPDWYGSGSELLNTIRRVKDKTVRRGFLEIEIPFEFSDVFRCPLVIEIENSGTVIESAAIAFKIHAELIVSAQAWTNSPQRVTEDSWVRIAEISSPIYPLTSSPRPFNLHNRLISARASWQACCIRYIGITIFFAPALIMRLT
ncbi:hypothetical protein IBX73_09860 [candidate division WOR-3 bacterium]|nr:hypothetical protein [candidate division WOR-3 bacterium]